MGGCQAAFFFGGGGGWGGGVGSGRGGVFGFSGDQVKSIFWDNLFSLFMGKYPLPAWKINTIFLVLDLSHTHFSIPVILWVGLWGFFSSVNIINLCLSEKLCILTACDVSLLN